jgi:hypothetical protein
MIGGRGRGTYSNEGDMSGGFFNCISYFHSGDCLKICPRYVVEREEGNGKYMKWAQNQKQI